MMALNPLTPEDGRVSRKRAGRPGRTYSYIIGEPEGRPAATAILVHGFPDLGYGWRHQVPYFLSLGLRVVVPDMLGYAETDRPDAPEEYTLKKMADDIKHLASIVGAKRIILGGHDWGGALVWKTAMWHPDLIQGVFSICTPFHPPQKKYADLEQIIASGHLTNFGYQLQFRGPEVQDKIQGREKVRQFLNAMYGGRGSSGELGFSAQKGVLFDAISSLGPSRLLSEADLDYYADEYCKAGPPELRGPLNWYRTRQLNFEDELPLAHTGAVKLEMPALFVTATQDVALPPSMSMGMDKFFGNLTRQEVNASHWALTQAPEEVNRHVANWMNEFVMGGALKSLL